MGNFGRFLSIWVINVVSLLIIDKLFAGIAFSSTATLVVTALVIAVLNRTLRPLLQVLSIPVTILTLGLFSLVVNAIVLMLAFSLVPGAWMDGFGTAFFASIVLGIINALTGGWLDD